MDKSFIYQVVSPVITAGLFLLIAWLLKLREDKKGRIVDPIKYNYEGCGMVMTPVIAHIGPESTFVSDKQPKLVCDDFIRDIYACMEHGREKYGPQSVKDMLEMNDWRYCFDAMIRHATRYEQEGELEDKDSGLHPMVHVAARAMILYMKDAKQSP